MNEKQLHGDAALANVIEPAPKGGFSMRGFTIRREKAAPIVDVPARKRTPPPVRVVDGIPPVLAARPRVRPPAPRPGSGLAFVDERAGAPIVNPPAQRTYGADAIRDALARKGISLSLAADGTHLIPRSAGGRILQTERVLIEQAAPLLLALLTGSALTCGVSAKHPGATDPTAITILAGGCPCCAFHLAERGAS